MVLIWSDNIWYMYWYMYSWWCSGTWQSPLFNGKPVSSCASLRARCWAWQFERHHRSTPSPKSSCSRRWRESEKCDREVREVLRSCKTILSELSTCPLQVRALAQTQQRRKELGELLGHPSNLTKGERWSEHIGADPPLFLLLDRLAVCWLMFGVHSTSADQTLWERHWKTLEIWSGIVKACREARDLYNCVQDRWWRTVLKHISDRTPLCYSHVPSCFLSRSAHCNELIIRKTWRYLAATAWIDFLQMAKFQGSRGSRNIDV